MHSEGVLAADFQLASPTFYLASDDDEEEDDPWEDEDDSEDDDKEDDPWEEEEQESPKDRRSRGDNDPEARPEATRPAESRRARTDRTQDFKPTREPLVLLSPRIGPAPPFPQMGLPAALNDELVLGLTVGIWPTRRLGLEVNLSGFPLGGTENTQQLAIAVLRLLDTSFRFESIDRDLSLTASVAALLLSGPISFFGAPEVHAELLLAFGGGIEKNSVEMLSYFNDGDSERAELAQAAQDWPRPVLNLSLGSRLFLHPKIGLRIDFRLQGGSATVLNYDDDQGAATNRELGNLANRLTCLDASIPANEKACKTTLEFSAGVEIGLEFAVVGSKAEARRHGK